MALRPPPTRHITPADGRAARAELRRDSANTVRDVKPFTDPPPEARGLPYDVVQRILAAISDQGSAMVKAKPRAAACAAKPRCRVLALTELRPGELMR